MASKRINNTDFYFVLKIGGCISNSADRFRNALVATTIDKGRQGKPRRFH